MERNAQFWRSSLAAKTSSEVLLCQRATGVTRGLPGSPEGYRGHQRATGVRSLPSYRVTRGLPGSDLCLLTVIANGQNRCVEIGVKANYLTMDTTTIPCGSGVGSCYRV